MSAPIDLRPGLRFYPDAAFYDECMSELRMELGRAPTGEDVARELWPAFAMSAQGEACIACGAKHANGAAAWRPGDVDSLIGYAACERCRKAHDAGGKALEEAVEARRAAEVGR